MKITICGSMQFEPKMADIARELEARGYQVDKPNVVEGHVYEDNLDSNALLKRGFIDEHFAKINTSDAILVVNEDKKGVANYIGGNTLIEISHAYAQGLDIFLLNPVPELSYSDEIRGMHPVLLNGDINLIDSYIKSLPLVYMSTESNLKQRAVSRAMRRAGIPVHVEGKKLDSGVPEQPYSLEGSLEGAKNRQAALRKLGVTADYLVTVESGLHPVGDDVYGCVAVLIEEPGRSMYTGLSIDLQYPQEVLDVVPSQYPDVGTWAMEVKGAKEKDPYSIFTGGRRSRQDTIEDAARNALISLLVAKETEV